MTTLRPFAAAVVFAFSVTAAHAAAVVGQPAPAFSVKDSRGKTHTLAQYQGKTVVLEWTNDQCPFVKKHYESGNMQALQKDATKSGVVWLSVISSAPGKQGHVLGKQADALTVARKAAPSAVLQDDSGVMGKAYGAKTTPHMYVIDKTGTLVYAGGIDDIPSAETSDIPKSRNFVKLALADLAAGKSVATATSRPYGCSVKY
jgi:peroxiredoxin